MERCIARQGAHLVSLIKTTSMLFLLAAALPLFISPAQAEPPAKPWAPGRLLVQPKAGLPDSELNKIFARTGATSKGRIGPLNVHIVDVPEQAEEAVARALARNPHIKFAEKDWVVELSETIPDDPKYSSAWHLPKIAAPLAWDTAFGDNITVAVLDTGVDDTHPDLFGKVLSGWNTAGNNSNTSDIHGHGTKVAGTAAASSNNSQGVASIAWNALIMPLRVTDSSDGWAYWSDIAEALTWAADQGAQVANISYDVTNSSTVSNAAQYFQSLGGIVVVAAGNSGSNPGYSDNPYMISVSATTSSDSKASWSSYGDYVDVSAPGAGIWTTTRGGSYGSVSGTSFASPATAGVVALILSANPFLSPGEIESILESTADDLGSSGWDSFYGHGRINAYSAVVAASETNAIDTQAPSVAILSPSEGATVSGTVAIDVSAEDNAGVTRVDLYANDQFVGSDTTSLYGFSWDSTQVADGSVSLIAYAYDAAGNEGVSSTVTLLVDNTPDSSDTTPPSVSITEPAEGSTVSGTVHITVNASDNTDLAAIQLFIDGAMRSATDTSPLSYSWNTRKDAKGSHSISAVAEDRAGNTATTSITVNVGSGSKGGSGGGKGNGNGKGGKDK
ncbi:peptidase S8 and S53 subtilisin kexin sedolisin [Nitrosococcus halophilus Nc 4]|uniref:Peptidase S8 and S53 subtilisin kexin sedolisin n=1 Tax=Nitrosococcus halophilus (strain Nc4) TaxID=472759 RepID=D5C5A2_NITHN|nr:S8 family serine peptidase [Nitrosococcus halophilus]ADE15325.1 peptidase S8 and S53 subtilisin kexin sedolisin [Nitrosococcus halophilus Nc 4]